MAGSGENGERKKRAKTSAAAAGKIMDGAPPVLTTPLGTLMRVEATLWINTKGGARGVPLGDFYSLARAHEWLGLDVKPPAANGGQGDEAAPANAPREVSERSSDVHALVGQLSEGERLLFDFVAVSGWQSKETPNLYPLYRLTAASSGKAQLELLQEPQQEEMKLAAAPAKTRSDILSSMYHRSWKLSESSLNWWEHAKGVAETIITDRKSTSTSKQENSVTGKAAVKSILSNGDNGGHASPAMKSNGEGKKMTLDERVRARSLRSEAIAKSKQSTAASGSPRASESKTLLELAEALRSYSQRRGMVSSGGGGSALDRLKRRASGGNDATTNIARLTVADLLKDARVRWKALVYESIDQTDGGGIKRGASAQVVSIDLSRVLFQLRLQMATDANVSDKRQMEVQLLGLLENLAAVVPKWIHLRKAPTASTGKKQTASANSKKHSIRQSTIVIRNDAVDFKEVRVKLGGRVHYPVGAAIKSSNGSKEAVAKGTKRSLPGTNTQLQGGPVSAADAIVPPSFIHMYGKALDKK